MAKKKEDNKMEKIVSLAKRRGFIYQGSEIYGGLAGTWDYGPNGIALKKNIENLWWRMFVDSRSDMYGIDSAILMHPKVWEASGHVEGFNDPLVECAKCKKRFREDHLEDTTKCPECGGKLGEAKQFNMMFKSSIGATADEESVVYLRPETAQGMFVNFKNILDTFHPKLPFGIAQIGKSFRNEISARDFIFRVRELEIMEFEYYIRESEWEKWFEYWRKEMWNFAEALGWSKENLKEVELDKDDLAHYSKRTIDFYYEYPFRSDEVFGLAYRTDHDLKQHEEHSKAKLKFLDEETGERLIPHVIEPTFGVGRTLLAVLSEAYEEEEVEGETRVVLKFKPELAPVKVAVLPLMRKEKLKENAQEIYDGMKKNLVCQYDETGSIGKRYRRQDEIGTPFCVTVDFETLEDKKVTVRERDTMKQERVAISDLSDYFKEKLS